MRVESCWSVVLTVVCASPLATVTVSLAPASASNREIAGRLQLGEATVKTYRRRDGHVWLMPHNEAYAPIPGDDAVVLGRVVTVLRKV